MPKLTDTQLVLLNKAVQRDDHAVARIDKRPATREAIESLLKQKLLATIAKSPDHAAWADDGEGGHLGLTVTSKGLKAIGAEDAAHGTTEGKDKTPKAPAAKPARSKSASGASTNAAPAGQRAGTKLDAIVKLMRRSKGASLAQMMTETGWQSHSVRGAISGAIKKKLGLAVTSERVGEERRYRIAG